MGSSPEPLDVQLKPLLNGGPSHRHSEAIGQQRLIWFKTGKLQPGSDVPSGFLPEGHRASLSAFAQQPYGTVIVSPHVLHPERESFGSGQDARPHLRDPRVSR
jgi:hypothetical protein